MRKVIAAINMTIDGFCDHTAVIANEELHQHYSELLNSAGVIMWGRITYQLMESSWPAIVKNPTGNKPIDEFAVIIDNISKIVFSHTLQHDDTVITGWKNARLARRTITKEILELKQSSNGGSKNILVGSPSLIVTSLNLNLIDEFQLCVHPTIAGKGLSLFKNINDRIDLKLSKTKTFDCGAMIFYYEPIKND